MKKALILYFFTLCLLPVKSFGQEAEYTKVEFTKPYSYTASNDDSRNSAKAKAMEEAQTKLLQELGVLVEARQKMTTTAYGDNSQQDFVEELNTYTIGKVQISVVDGTESFVENVYSATFSMVVDTADLYGYLDGIVKQKEKARADSLAQLQQARADSLAIVKKKAEMEQEMERRRLTQLEQARIDSLAKAKKVSELELSVRTARNLLEQEQEREKPLRIAKEQKERELQDSERQKNSAQRAFDNAKNDRDAYTDIGAQRIESERKLLQKAIGEYDKKQAEYKIAYENLNNANERVKSAERNLREAEEKLAKETKIKSVSEQTKTATTYNSQSKRVKMETMYNNNRKFVFSIRPEYVLGTSVNGVGGSIELGAISKNSFYFSTQLNGGNIYFGGGLNIGGCFNKDGAIKNVLGLNAGFSNTLRLVEFKKDGKMLASKTGQNISIAGAFWKLMFGGKNNFDITNKILLGYKKNPIAYKESSREFVYDKQLNTTYVLGVGYTLTKNKR